MSEVTKLPTSFQVVRPNPKAGGEIRCYQSRTLLGAKRAGVESLLKHSEPSDDEVALLWRGLQRQGWYIEQLSGERVLGTVA